MFGHYCRRCIVQPTLFIRACASVLYFVDIESIPRDASLHTLFPDHYMAYIAVRVTHFFSLSLHFPQTPQFHAGDTDAALIVIATGLFGNKNQMQMSMLVCATVT